MPSKVASLFAAASYSIALCMPHLAAAEVYKCQQDNGTYLYTDNPCNRYHNVTTYRNERFGFEISYLNNWKLYKARSDAIFSISRKSTKEPAVISINIANFTGNKYKFMHKIEIQPEIFVKQIRHRFPDATLLESDKTYLGSHPAYYFLINYTLKNLNVTIDTNTLIILCIKNKKLYLVNFEAYTRYFREVAEEFQAMLATFNFR